MTHSLRAVSGLSLLATTREITAGANPKDEIRAIVRALNKTAAQARTGASKAVRASGYNIKASAIKKSFSIERATPGRLSVTLRATGAPVTLINYGATQTKRGVSVRVKNGRKLLRHAFIATMPNGHKGVFEREGTGHKLITKNGRSYMSGLPIRELYGPSIPDALSNDAVQKALAQTIADKYPAILAHELAWLAAKG
ncbi:phage tail protein [Caballeronia sp. BR00000012568055]|uniref:phage tail protein n=1 Tax=Caballeronia sp. BR00000012568055 TaxID=2918761 RepID=UPI0023F6CAA7|nr:phage tail protein [Caballeronia sp. BR00000012568055]